MIDFLWQYAFNMKLPLTCFMVVVTLIGLIVINDARKMKANFKEIDTNYETLDFRIWLAEHIIAIVAILWLLFMAVPSPDFKKDIVVQTRTQTVIQKVGVPIYKGERVVWHTPTYEDAFNKCLEGAGYYSSRGDLQVSAQCHKQAEEASLPPFRTVTKTVYVRDPFDKLWKDCVDLYGVDPTGDEKNQQPTINNRNVRMEICRRVALTGATGQP